MNLILSDMALILPELFLSGTAMALLILGAFFGPRSFGVVMGAGIVALLIAAGQELSDPSLHASALMFSGLMATTIFTALIKAVCLVGLAMALMISFAPLRAEGIDRFEYPVLVMLSGVGMMVMIGASDMLTIYVGLELSSLALYVLAAFRRDSVVSAEAGMKYFILGALSSGILLFGMSLVYGFTGATHFDGIGYALSSGVVPQNHAGIVVGMAFMLAGFAFKVSAVPFHMWTPDVYQGAPSPVTALFAMVPKIAALGVMMALLFGPFASVIGDWGQIIGFLSFASMIWGAFGAVVQTNIKRLLAYGAIGNMGYALMGVLAGTPEGISGAILYVIIYLFMSAGTFAILLALRRQGAMIEHISDFSGLSRTHKGMATILMVMMFAMAGIPPLAGFFGKLMVFQAAVSSGYLVLAVIGVLSSVVAAYYYINVIRVMFFEASPSHPIIGRCDAGQILVTALAIIFVIGFVFVPNTVYAPIERAAGVLMHTPLK